MTDKKDEHTCSYYCMHPACVIAQRDFLRDKVEQIEQDLRQLLSEERTHEGPRWIKVSGKVMYTDKTESV